jgi:hypothetical protein
VDPEWWEFINQEHHKAQDGFVERAGDSASVDRRD